MAFEAIGRTKYVYYVGRFEIFYSIVATWREGESFLPRSSDWLESLSPPHIRHITFSKSFPYPPEPSSVKLKMDVAHYPEKPEQTYNSTWCWNSQDYDSEQNRLWKYGNLHATLDSLTASHFIVKLWDVYYMHCLICCFIVWILSTHLREQAEVQQVSAALPK